MLNIDDELKKIKEYLDKNITLKSEIVPNYDLGNCIKVKTYMIENSKMVKCEYTFYIKYDENKDNYVNAPYLLHCHFDYNNGGRGYADKYESLEDFKNSNMVKELVETYNKKKIDELHEIMNSGKKLKVEFTKTPTLFDEIDNEEETTDDTEELTLFDLDNEDINVSSEDNQLSLFDEVDPVDNNVDLEDLLSYGIDDYYMNNLYGETFGVIYDELNKLPKYKEYYEKLRSYLKSKLPNGTFENTKFDGKPTFITDTKNIISIRGNRQQCPIYVYKMYENNFE